MKFSKFLCPLVYWDSSSSPLLVFAYLFRLTFFPSNIPIFCNFNFFIWFIIFTAVAQKSQFSSFGAIFIPYTIAFIVCLVIAVLYGPIFMVFPGVAVLLVAVMVRLHIVKIYNITSGGGPVCEFIAGCCCCCCSIAQSKYSIIVSSLLIVPVLFLLAPSVSSAFIDTKDEIDRLTRNSHWDDFICGRHFMIHIYDFNVPSNPAH